MKQLNNSLKRYERKWVFDNKNLNIDYNQILIVDADTIIHPNAPDVFELTDNKFCAVHNYGSYDWICRSIENYKKHLFPDVDVPLFEYFNSGVIVCNKNHKEFYNKIIKSRDTYNKKLKPNLRREIIIPSYENKQGNPILFSKFMKNEIMKIKNDDEIKKIIELNKEKILNVPIKSDGVILDFDTQNDFVLKIPNI